MTQVISKSRAKKLRSREKKSSRPSLQELLTFKDSPIIGMAIAIVLWLLASTIINVEAIFAGGMDEGSFFPLAGDSIYLLITLIACPAKANAIITPTIPKGIERNIINNNNNNLQHANGRAFFKGKSDVFSPITDQILVRDNLNIYIF